MYADNIVALAPPTKSFQTLLYICFRFSKDRKIQFNAKKTVGMQIWPHKYREIPIGPFVLGRVLSASVEEVKYLGNMICASMKDFSDLNRVFRLHNTNGNVLIRKFSNCNTLVKTRTVQNVLLELLLRSTLVHV